MTIYGLPSNNPNPDTFTKDIFVKFVPKYKDYVEGDGSALYDSFANIADQKILFTIWGTDWEFITSYCIAHYLDITNRETQKSFSLEEIAKDSGPKGQVVSNDKIKYDFKNTLVTHQYALFWNMTFFGSVILNMVSSKGISTLLVAN